MAREMREAGPLAVMLYPIIAVGTIGAALLRLICGPCDEANDYEYQF
jgi:nitrate reductase NapE component